VAGFAGGYVHAGGQRLYDEHLFGLRFDKYVHFWSGLMVGPVVLGMLRVRGLRITRFQMMLAFLYSLGVLSIWEVGESVMRSRIPENGIGGYSDTVGDLWANLAGGVVFLLAGRWVHRRIWRSFDEPAAEET